MEGNTLTHNGDGIVVDGSGVKQNRSLSFRNNQLTANTGNDLSIAWADGVLITGNIFTAPPALPAGAKPRAPISVRDSANVGISGNQFTPSPAYAPPFVSVGDNVTQITQDVEGK